MNGFKAQDFAAAQCIKGGIRASQIVSDDTISLHNPGKGIGNII